MSTIEKNVGKFHSDRWSGVVLVLFAGGLICVGSSLPFGNLTAPDSGFFPIILAALLFVLGCVQFIGSFAHEGVHLEFTERSWGVAVCAACLFAYAILIDRIGFLICTSVVLILLMRFYGRLRWRAAAAISILLVLIAAAGFKELGVSLPRGILGVG